jgi:hypothetical protein
MQSAILRVAEAYSRDAVAFAIAPTRRLPTKTAFDGAPANDVSAPPTRRRTLIVAGLGLAGLFASGIALAEIDLVAGLAVLILAHVASLTAIARARVANGPEWTRAASLLLVGVPACDHAAEAKHIRLSLRGTSRGMLGDVALSPLLFALVFATTVEDRVRARDWQCVSLTFARWAIVAFSAGLHGFSWTMLIVPVTAAYALVYPRARS